MDVLEQEFKAAASGAIAHPRGCDKALEALGWTGRRDERIALVCPPRRGVDPPAEGHGSWTRTTNSLGAAIHADRVGVAAGETVPAVGGSNARVSMSKGPMRRVEPERPWLRRTGLSDAAKAGEPAYPLGPRFAGPRQGLAGGCAPSDPPNGNGT